MGKKREVERPDLAKAVWLLERMQAKDNPITYSQVHSFGTRPDGPILPDLCLETRKLPDSYKRFIGCLSDEPADQLLVTPDGQLCLASAINDISVVICGNKVYELMPNNERFCIEIEILGFSSDGLPITRLEGMPTSSLDMGLPIGPWIIFKGSEKILEDDGLYEATLLRNGLVISFSRTGKGAYKVCKNSEVIIPKTDRQYRLFFETPDGQILALWDDKDSDGNQIFVPGIFDASSPFGKQNVKDIVWTTKGVRFINRFARMFRYDEKNHWLTYEKEIGENEYISSYTELDDGRVCYIGSSRRDRDFFRCWNVAGKQQPIFNLVSPLFKRDDQMLYYGIIGRHLCTMAIPEKNE